MDKHQKILDHLSRVAVAVEPVAAARLASAIVYRNEIVAFGVNQNKTHPMQARFGKNAEAIYLHSEIDAIKNTLRLIDVDDLTKCTLYTCRMKHHHNKKELVRGLACPCAGCARAIATFKISQVVYSLNDSLHYGLFR